MISIYDVLKASKGIHVDDTFAELWGRKLSNAYTVATYSGTLPATLQTVEGHLESYKIYGNTEQTGTPTPENPIIPSGCGELETTGAHAGQYKLPLTSAGQDVDIYLGEVETTRRIKKYECTGEEEWVISSNVIFATPYTGIISGYYQSLCDRYVFKKIYNDVYYTDGTFAISNTRLIIHDENYTTIQDFKTYLQQQYAAGTPVTVWYVLEEPETGIVNEPLMKIGDYADTVSMEQAGVSIPTAPGETTISWAGEGLAPSEVELTYRKPKGQ